MQCGAMLVPLARARVLVLLAHVRVLVQLACTRVPVLLARVRVLVQLACALVLRLQGRGT